jgi:methionyl aminopeptidase
VIIRKSPAEIDKMAAAGDVLVRCHKLLQSKVRPGVTTEELDAAAEKFIRSQGAEPSFKGYNGFPGPSAPRRTTWSCTASRLVQGPQGRRPVDRHRRDPRRLGGRRREDLRGRPVTPVAEKLLKVTEESLVLGAAQAKPGNRLGAVSNAIQRHVEAEGLSIVRSLVGHGIGRDMHEAPQIPNFGSPDSGPKLEEGMVLAIEPMVTAGRHAVRMGDDHWAIYSQDGSLAAHFEFTVAVTAAGPRILTPWHEDRGKAAA